jgi:plastocyanin
MRRFGLPLVLVALVTMAGLFVGPAQADKSVSMKASKYDPKDLSAKVGEKVTWKNNDGSLGHSVRADDGSYDSHPKCGQVGGTCMSGGETFSHKFTKAGRYPYYCRTHGAPGGQGMAGVVNVG